ncbi:peptidase M14 [Virgisporangium aliadipatigenens]|uniref:Peptidase M14 n=1 Tax=Virgisporangium aliadipatigenens TaxID=741659 RepID=A0A8J4DUD9_9ACTN|nr:M14 family zinc carboxypeptidase [Virgisporangium aliadipatigenens]GIJ50724.1 peptidase M14 [Virgisporangium aliadipatigenens]
MAQRFLRKWKVAGSAALLAVTGAAVAGQTEASAAEQRTLTAAQSQVRKCHGAVAKGQRGVAGFEIKAPSTGLVRVQLDPSNARNKDEDWDVAVFEKASGALVAASAGLRSYEIADGNVTSGATLWVQGCRYRGDARTVSAAVTFVGTSAATARAASDPAQLVAVDTPTREAKQKLNKQELDVTESATESTVDVVLHGKADADKLKGAGFTFTVKIPNLADHLKKTEEADKAYRQRTPRSDLPSGRTEYRRLADYDYEMKELARRNPLLVKAFALPHRSVEGRDITGVEIAINAANKADGKPIFFNMGVHHAREWPAGESAMEWATDLVNGFGREARTTRLVAQTRNIVVPIVNPDGFSISRQATPLGDFTTFDYEMKRKNCQPDDAPPQYQTGLCPANPAGRLRGVDLNRNYGGFWGGPGASTNWSSDTYRGSEPFSEPEAQNIRELVSSRAVTNLITNHTYGPLVLRPPGVYATGQAVDEPLLAAVGKSMTDHNGYANIPGYQLYDTTGTTEDWTYWVTGGLGYTFEIGNAGFHPPFADAVIGEYLGRAPSTGAGKGGNREAYFAMLESTADSAHHSVIKGEAPPGHTLRVHKEFQTPTSPVIQPDGSTAPPIMYTDVIDNTIRPVGPFTWHVNPSTRPYVAGRYGRYPTAPPQPAQSLANPPGQPGENTSGDPLSDPREVVPFTIGGTPQYDNGSVRVRMEWTDPANDWDLFILNEQDEVVSQAASFGTNYEEALLIEPVPGNYRAVLVNYDQVDDTAYDDWTSLVVTGESPKPPVPGVTEAYTLTCERPNGSIAAVRQVIVGRGQTVDVGDFCRRRKR